MDEERKGKRGWKEGRKEGRKGLNGGDRDGEWARRNEGKSSAPFLPSLVPRSRFVSFARYTANERWDHIKDARVKIMRAQIDGGVVAKM